MDDSGPITTADSQADGRLKVAAGCSHGKKKCLKCVISKAKDGKGGPGITLPTNAGYGAPPAAPGFAMKSPALSLTGKPHRSTRLISGAKIKGMKSLSSSMKSLNKKNKFGSAVKSAKIKSLKSLMKGMI